MGAATGPAATGPSVSPAARSPRPRSLAPEIPETPGIGVPAVRTASGRACPQVRASRAGGSDGSSGRYPLPRLHDREQAADGLGAALEAHADQRLWAGAQAGEVAGEPVRRLVELAVGQPGVPGDDGGRARPVPGLAGHRLVRERDRVTGWLAGSRCFSLIILGGYEIDSCPAETG